MAGEAPDYGSMLGDILGNPEAMEGVMRVAKAMGLSGGAGSRDSSGTSAAHGARDDRTGPDTPSGPDGHQEERGSGMQPSVNAASLGGGLSALLGDRKDEEHRERLLIALRPYLNDSRSGMLDTVLRLMRLARLGDIGKLIGKL